MKKIIASLALSAALGTGFAAGAQAQTVSNLGTASLYALQVTTTTPAGILVGPNLYEYSYTATLLADSPVNVNSFTIGNISGAIPGAATVTAETLGWTSLHCSPAPPHRSLPPAASSSRTTRRLSTSSRRCRRLGPCL